MNVALSRREVAQQVKCFILRKKTNVVSLKFENYLICSDLYGELFAKCYCVLIVESRVVLVSKYNKHA